jgi:flavin-dependent dehydrogenase
MARNPSHDVLVIGEGPAGAAAAILLARRKRRVLLLSGDTDACPTLDWLHPRASQLLTSLGADPGGFAGGRVTHLTFTSADFSKRADVEVRQGDVLAVNRAGLADALLAAAKKAGVAFQPGPPAGIEVSEDAVRAIDANGATHQAGILILAAGPQRQAVQRVGLRMQETVPAHRFSACWPGPGPKRSPTTPAECRLTLTLGERTGVILTAEGCTCATLFAGDAPTKGRSAFEAFAQKAIAAGHLPRQRAKSMPAMCVGTLLDVPALDVDSHVGKRLLLIGAAGGFANPQSGQELWPALHSAEMAAEVTHQALESDSPQDALIGFDRQWRTGLADALQWPQADLPLMLPLIFANQPMAERLADSLWAGAES